MATYFSFQGEVYIGQKNTDGSPKSLYYVGNSPEVVIAFDTTTIEHKESTSCARLTDFQLETEKKVSLRIVLEELLATDLEKALRSTGVSVTGAAVTNEQLGPSSGVVANDFFRTKFTDLSAITVKDSASPTPATLTLGTHYQITSAKYGLIKIINIGSFVQPFKIDYTFVTQTLYPYFNTAQLDYYCVFNLCNTAESNKKYRLELYKVQLKPTQEFAIINDELGRFQLEGAALYDSSLGTDPNFGNFGRLIPIA